MTTLNAALIGLLVASLVLHILQAGLIIALKDARDKLDAQYVELLDEFEKELL